jgi:hypothetical protein
MIVSRYHVLRTEVQEGSDVRAGYGLEEVGVTPGDTVGQAAWTCGEEDQKNHG